VIGGIDHAGLTVSDLDRALAFWCDVLGLRLHGRERSSDPDLAALLGLDEVELEIADLLTADGRIVELIHYRRPAGRPLGARTYDPGGGHVALAVDDLDATLARVRESEGAVISHRPLTLHDPGGLWDGATCCYVRDPDGAVVELVQRP
jgi:glyoxylase I family protein